MAWHNRPITMYGFRQHQHTMYPDAIKICRSRIHLYFRGDGGSQQLIVLKAEVAWLETNRKNISSGDCGSGCQAQQSPEELSGDVKSSVIVQEAPIKNDAVVLCDMEGLAFKGLSVIVFCCLGLGDRESQLWGAPATLSLSMGKTHGTECRDSRHLVFILVAQQS